MSWSPRATILGAALAVLACGDIGAPVRDDLYEWRLFVPFGGAIDTIHFHWARDDLPVRVWVAQDDIPELPGLMQRAVDTWEQVFLYGEFRAELVSDSSTADVIVRGTGATAKMTSQGLRLESALAPECNGATDIEVSDDLAELTLPIRIFIAPAAASDDPGLGACLALTSIHELGHALGILAHSPNRTDIMFADPQVELPSEFDRETAEAAYHLPPTIRVVGPAR
jgi:predicted Zn-dependent protease